MDRGILASRTSITTSINLSCSLSSFSVFAMWPGYHCKRNTLVESKRKLVYSLNYMIQAEDLKPLMREWRMSQSSTEVYQFQVTSKFMHPTGFSQPITHQDRFFISHLDRTQSLSPVIKISIQINPIKFLLGIRNTAKINIPISMPTRISSTNYLQKYFPS